MFDQLTLRKKRQETGKKSEQQTYGRLGAWERIHTLTDEESFKEFTLFHGVPDPIEFPDYIHKIEKGREKSSVSEALIIGAGKLGGHDVVIGAMDASFMMGTMGTVVGEKLTQGFEYAIKHRLPVVLFIASGGARMQEGIFSLMQMAKVSAVIAKHSRGRLLYIPILTDPTLGGVTASFGMLGDIILAEPGAIIGFAGPRVIEQTLNKKLPEGFQKAEYLLERGFIDGIVPREQMKQYLQELIEFHTKY